MLILGLKGSNVERGFCPKVDRQLCQIYNFLSLVKQE